jgi:hypothetical protein
MPVLLPTEMIPPGTDLEMPVPLLVTASVATGTGSGLRAFTEHPPASTTSKKHSTRSVAAQHFERCGMLPQQLTETCSCQVKKEATGSHTGTG